MITMEDVVREIHPFYRETLALLRECGEEFLVGGGFAFCFYTGIARYTKDLDIFCRSSQVPRVLQFFAQRGYRVEQTDVRWLAKVFKDDHFMDIIFDSPNNICSVDDTWFQHSTAAAFEGIPVRLIPVEELIWCKTFVQNRERFDGADVNHLLVRQGMHLDWHRLLFRLDRHWQLLLAELLIFQFIYPSAFQEIVPRKLMEELLQRAAQQYDIPPTVEKICRGPLIDQTQYATDILDWHYKVTTIKTI